MQHCKALGNTFTLGEEQLAPGDHHRHHQDLHKHLVQVVGVAGVVSLCPAVGSSLQHQGSRLDRIARPSCSIADLSCCSPKLQRSIAPPACQTATQSKVRRNRRQITSSNKGFSTGSGKQVTASNWNNMELLGNPYLPQFDYKYCHTSHKNITHVTHKYRHTSHTNITHKYHTGPVECEDSGCSEAFGGRGECLQLANLNPNQLRKLSKRFVLPRSW